MQTSQKNSAITLIRLFALCVALVILSVSCKDKDDDDESKPDIDTSISNADSIYYMTNYYMQEIYLWYEYIPENLDIYSYSHPNDLMQAMLYEPLDKWSGVVETELLDGQIGSGEYYNIGFMVAFESNTVLRVIYVYENSTAATLGICKGNILRKIDGVTATSVDISELNEIFFGTSPVTYTMEITGNNGVNQNYTISKTEFEKNAVLYSDIDTIKSQKTAYFVYNSFAEYSISELETLFSYYKAENIDELIVDLRFNGGGYIEIARMMADIIAPASAEDQPMFSYAWNDKYAPIYDTTYNFSNNSNNLDLDRVFFITSSSTASSSEMLINSLDPYMNVYLIGSKTHGKPVGYPVIPFQDYYIIPVAFRTVNANNYGDYFDGFPVDQSANISLATDWGDTDDPNLEQAYHYIEHGSFDYSKSYDADLKTDMNMSILKPYSYELMIAGEIVIE